MEQRPAVAWETMESTKILLHVLFSKTPVNVTTVPVRMTTVLPFATTTPLANWWVVVPRCQPSFCSSSFSSVRNLRRVRLTCQVFFLSERGVRTRRARNVLEYFLLRFFSLLRLMWGVRVMFWIGTWGGDLS